MYSGLSLQQAPPLSVPVRFFLTAPVFGVLAVLLVLVQGSDLLTSRWTPGILAVTHFLVLGFFATIMIGALQQILPVLAGAVIQRPRLTATLVHAQWIPGVLFLAVAFLHGRPAFFLLAIVLLGGAVISFAIAVILSFLPVNSAGESVPGIKLSITSLIVTLILGVLLALGWVGIVPLWRPVLTDIHLTWGLVGWMAVLIMVVAWQVVPMFQITPSYPRLMRRWTVPIALILLVLKSLSAWQSGLLGGSVVETVTESAIAFGLLAYALATLNLQRQARRRVRDSHRDFWRLAMGSLILAVLLWMGGAVTGDSRLHLMASAVFLMGFTMSVVTGMLLKIVPFLIWLHLTAANDGLRIEGHRAYSIPKMKSIIPARSGDRLLYLLTAAVLTTIGALVFPVYFCHAAAALWLLQFCYLEAVMARALLRYRKVSRNIAALKIIHGGAA